MACQEGISLGNGALSKSAHDAPYIGKMDRCLRLRTTLGTTFQPLLECHR